MSPVIDDDVSIDELQKAVEHMHGVPARFVEAVEVDERFNGEIVWQGAVKVFALAGTRAGDAGVRVELPDRGHAAGRPVPHVETGGTSHGDVRARVTGAPAAGVCASSRPERCTTRQPRRRLRARLR